ncbi:MAG: GNAT family N-acetyltransferase [Oscillospiraceae bacterium]|nr:GNAT family N-acetyltransferase [Oscillospiraceae bacterium]
MYQIIPYAPQYRDDMIFCLLLAKDALGYVPHLNEDLLNVQANYFARGDAFWLAVDNNDRVIGMVGTHTVSADELWLKRLYVKPNCKRQGVASALLRMAEDFARAKGIACVHTRFNDDYHEAAGFYPAMGFVATERSDGCRHLVKRV